jgi:hypothetical protein
MTIPAECDEISVALAKKVVVAEMVNFGGAARAVKCLAAMADGEQIGESAPFPVNAG